MIRLWGEVVLLPQLTVVKAIHFLEAAFSRQFGRLLIYLRKIVGPKMEP